jgi:Fic family protein
MRDTNELTHMLFTAPEPEERELAVVDAIEALKRQLRLQLYEPRRWVGSLRRLSFARAIQGSNSIEGFNASLDDVAAAADGEEPLDADTETKMALWGYRQALTYVLQLAGEPEFDYSDQLIKSLHFMMTDYDMSLRPGLWRSGPIFVHNDATDENVYEGPDVELVPDLVRALAEVLNAADSMPPMIRAGMAHLNLVMIHPFRDGNGRMARCLQTLVLAREGILAPQFCSIEEYLGANTQDYYDVLGEVGGGSWHPERSARPWVRFTLTAHLRQARTMLRRIHESERLWASLDDLASRKRLNERLLTLMFDAAIGLRVRNSTYRAMNNDEISEGVATRDLKALVDHDLLEPHGEKRGRYYTATEELRAVWERIVADRPRRDSTDPFAAPEQGQLVEA